MGVSARSPPGLTLERGILQVSGVAVRYDPERSAGQRALSIAVGGEPLDPAAAYPVATITMLAQGGDTYRMLAGRSRRSSAWGEYAAVLEAWVAEHDPIELPARRRYTIQSSSPPRGGER